ncbi:arginine--tRNA ligase [Candidatus Woesearchaeota archaeon]|nr:arginine--tRNA ligase [Candidatus Woesearchaeota archaeon]
MFEQELKELIKKHLKQDVELEVPPDQSMGDYALACFPFAKLLKKGSHIIAQELAKSIKLPKFLERIELKGGYVNFFLNKKFFAEVVLKQIQEKKENYGSSSEGIGKTIVLDFSHPNIAKPFGIGHLRSTMMGNSLNKIYNHFSYKTVRVNHLGDWGTQFGALLAAYFKWGNSEKLAENPIIYLFELYTKFHKEEEKNPFLHQEAKEWFKKLEKGNSEALKLWSKFKHLSLDEFRKIYDLVSVEFDSYDGESFYNDKLEQILDVVKEKGLLVEDQHAQVVKLQSFETPLILVKSDGASTYELRDLAAMKFRRETYAPDKIIYVVGNEQTYRFKQLFRLADMLGWPEKQFVHVSFGLYRFQEGKMSTRKGKIIFMEDVLNQAIEKTKKIIEEKNPELKDKEYVAKQIGVGAIIFGDLVNDRIRDILFDWDKILDFEGDTGPYVQYTHARACAILRKAKEQKIDQEKIDYSVFSAKEHALITELSRLHLILKDCLNNYKPHILAQYLIKLCRLFNEFYHSSPVLQSEESLRSARLLLVDCTRQVLNTGLKLLGINTPEEM